MRSSVKFTFCAAAVLALAALPMTARAAVVDTIDASNPGTSVPTYWVPAPGLELTPPYYRGEPASSGSLRGADWGWTHGAIPGSFSQVNLNISAFDVDFSSGERDAIYVGSNSGPGAYYVGFLNGTNNAFSFTNFDLTALIGNAILAPMLTSGL